jgi:ABC-type Na+ transport system ATPase subunit NatA
VAVTGSALIEARGLCVRFGKVAALDGLDLVARPGRVLAILGPNGAGKTTFVRTVATLVPPSGGGLRVRGIDVTSDPVAVRREIGLAGQFAAVEPVMTGRENLRMVARLFGHRRKAAEAACEAVIEMLGLGEVADRRAGAYSGGQRRRLDLGASLVGAPRLLLLDEPTTGLDPAGRAEVWAAVRRLVAAGTDIVLTTHYLEEADGLAALGLCLLYGLVFTVVFIVIGLFAPNAQAAQGMSMIAFVLAFVSSTYVPPSSMPGWLQPFATHQPVTPMVNAVRSALTGGSHDLTAALIWSAALIAAFMPIAVIRYRRA